MNSNTLQMDPVATLLAAVNVALGSTFDKTNCVLSAPTRTGDLSRNTKFELFCLPISGRIGKYTIYYNRLHYLQLTNQYVERKQSVYTSDLLEQINTLNGVYISQADIVDVRLPDKTGNVGKIYIMPYISFAESSWFWYSGAVSTNVLPLVAPKSTVVTDVILDVGCHGWALVETTVSAGGALIETTKEEHSTQCGWDDGTANRATGWLRFSDSARTNSGEMHFKQF